MVGVPEVLIVYVPASVGKVPDSAIPLGSSGPASAHRTAPSRTANDLNLRTFLARRVPNRVSPFR